MDELLVQKDGGLSQFRVYRARWLMLLLFSLGNFTNAAVWITFAPIQELVSSYYDVGATAVDMLSMTFMILYLPGTLLASHMMNKRGTGPAVLFGVVLTALGCWIRYVGTFVHPHSARAAFALCLLGQSLAGLAQPFFTNAPAKIAETWFSEKERDLATTVGALFNPLGNAAGNLVPSIIVATASRMPALLLVEAAFASAAALLCVLLFRSKPPTLPSRAASQRVLLRARSMGAGSQALSVEQLWEDAKLLLRNREFMKLALGFGLGLGVFNAVMTVVAQLVRPCGYTSSDAGVFGGVVLGAGILSAAVVAPIMDRTHAYRPLLKAGIITCVGSALLFIGFMRPNQFALTVVLFAVLGACLLPMLPIAIANAVECTYPLPEEASAGLMLLVGQCVGVAATLALSHMLERAPKFSTPVTGYNVLLLATLLCATVPVMLYRGPYLRLQAERQQLLLPCESSTPQGEDEAMEGVGGKVRGGYGEVAVVPLDDGEAAAQAGHGEA